MQDEDNPIKDNIRDVFTQGDVAEIAQLLANVFDEMSRGIDEILMRLPEQSSRQEQGVSAHIPRRVDPSDDLDLFFSEMREYLRERTSHWRFYENFFYGLVLVILLLNTGLLLWLHISL